MLIAIGWLSVFAANPSYWITPASWSNLKLYCKYNFNIALTPSWVSYNAFDATLKFNSWEVNIIHSSIDPFFSISATGSIRSGYLYRTQWASAGWASSSSDINPASFVFYSIGNILNTTLNFTNCNGWTASFGTWTTADCSTVNSSVNNLDILLWLNDASYNFSPLPCIIDADNPSISNLNVSNWATYIPSSQTISMLINDRSNAPLTDVTWPSPLQTNKRSHYRYQWLSTWSLSNYVDAPDTVDNQEWVNPNSIKITVSWISYWPYILSWAGLSLTNFAWDWTKNQYTWDSEIRWYNVSFTPPSPYPIEKQITVSITANDRANESGLIHTWTSSFSFNAPVAPVITMLSPSPITFVNPTFSGIQFYITDDRAWVDTWSIKITIPAIYSWATLLMSGYTYSWSDLVFVLSWWAVWLGSGWDYIVTLAPKRDFPANSTVNITWAFADLVWTNWTTSFSFSTRPDCSYFGCSIVLGIDINWIISNFDWDFLIITWTNPDWPYPYFTWINNDTLMCWPNFTWTTITWNILFENTNNQSILWIFYTWARLYITWLNLILSWNTVFIQ